MVEATIPEYRAAYTTLLAPLVGASAQDVAQRAIEFSRANFRSVNGTPEVKLARPVLASQLPSLGLYGVPYADNDPPLMLVILHGDFDIAGGFPGWDRNITPGRKIQVSHVAYVFDLRLGAPTLIATSPRGGRFRQALNDPSLPLDPTPVAAPPLPAGYALTPAPTAPPYRGPYGATLPASPAAMPTLPPH